MFIKRGASECGPSQYGHRIGALKIDILSPSKPATEARGRKAKQSSSSSFFEPETHSHSKGTSAPRRLTPARRKGIQSYSQFL